MTVSGDRMLPLVIHGEVGVEILIIAAFLGLIPAFIAQSKGRSFGAWWLYGFLLFIVALIHSLCLSGSKQEIENIQLNQGMVRCPLCAELIRAEAIKCKHCGSDVSALSAGRGVGSAKALVASDFVTEDQDGDVVLNYDGIKAFANQLHNEMPKNSALSVMVTHEPVIRRLRDGLPENLRKNFEVELEGMLRIIKKQ